MVQQKTRLTLIVDLTFVHVLRKTKTEVKLLHHLTDVENGVVSIKCNDKCIHVKKEDEGRISKFKLQNETLFSCVILHDLDDRQLLSDFAFHDCYIIPIETLWMLICEEINGQRFCKLTFEHLRVA